MDTNDFNSSLIGCEKSLLAYALTLTRNHDDAKDLVQEAYLKAILCRDAYQDTNFKAWMMTIIHNLYLNSISKLSAKKTDHNMLDNDDMLKNKWGHNDNAEMEIDTNDITTTLSSLNADYNVPLTMYIDGYKYKEIADVTHLPIGTVKSRIFSARKIVSDKLKDFK